MAKPKSIAQPVELRSAFRKRPKFTSVAERLVILALLIVADIIVDSWWARLAISLVALVALFNVFAVALLARRRSHEATRSDEIPG